MRSYRNCQQDRLVREGFLTLMILVHQAELKNQILQKKKLNKTCKLRETTPNKQDVSNKAVEFSE